MKFDKGGSVIEDEQAQVISFAQCDAVLRARSKWKSSLLGKYLNHVAIVGLAATMLVACVSGIRNDASTQLKYEATIIRTHFGIPHIKARDFAGLGFGAAYARAQDNFCLIAEAYVSTNGERSKFFGASGTTVIGLVPAKNLDSDVFYRAVPDLDRLRVAFARSSSDYQAMIDGWIAGYNRFLLDHKEMLPAQCANQPWVREITRDDVLRSINGFSILSSSSTLATQIVNATPPTQVSTTGNLSSKNATRPSDEASLGSNGWAFGGDATTNGKGLVVSNPHFPWFGPNRFYEEQLTIPGTLDVAGVAIMNLPFVGIGFNRDVAWTHTVDMAAHMTLYKLTLDPSDPTFYSVDGQREAMTRREIRVENKDGSTSTRTVYASRFGPVLSVAGTELAWTREKAYAVADADNGNIRTGDTWLGIAKAHSVKDVREALAHYLGAPFLNTMAADRSGTALYADITAVPNVPEAEFASCGVVQDRIPGQLQDLYVLDGSRSACSWEKDPTTIEPGLLPASQMATIYRRDFVQNSNDSYRWTNPAEVLKLGPIMGRDPGLGGLRTRAGIQEITAVLRSEKFDIDLAAQTMLSNRWLAADLVLPSLRNLCTRPTAPADACAALAGWDGKAEIDSRGAMLFNLFWAKVSNRPDIWRVGPDPNDPLNTPRDFLTEGRTGDELLAALKSAADTMLGLGLPPDAALGQAQFAERGDERIPISGAQYGGVLNYMKTVPAKTGFSVIHGSSYIQSVTFDGEGPVAKAVLTYSQSTNPASPFFSDQTREFSNKTLHSFPYTEAEIAADAIGAPLVIRQ